MMQGNLDQLRDDLNRTAKLDLDTGTAPDIASALARMQAHRVAVVVGPEVTSSSAHQAALLTVVNVARRFALGGVFVSGEIETPLLGMGGPPRTLRAEVEAQGGRVGACNDAVPTVQVGSPVKPPLSGIAVTFDGWRGGVVGPDAPRLSERTVIGPAAVLAGALAAAEVFAMLRGEVEAGRRTLGLSLWRLDRSADWLSSASDGPPLTVLPNDMWVLGLGHLGQAFLWTLLFLPYTDRSGVRLVLQDTDVITGSTDSTSILTQRSMIGRSKARAVASVLDGQGFRTSIIERPFGADFQRREADDPSILICGVDNVLARSSLEHPGFPFVVEAGIGDRAQDFRALRVHTFPARRRAADLWQPGGPRPSAKLDHPAYQRLLEGGGDVCGLTRLAETAVGAPFVGTVAGCLMLSQVLRLLVGDHPDAVVDLDLRVPRARRALPNDAVSFFNPGFQRAEPPNGRVQPAFVGM